MEMQVPVIGKVHLPSLGMGAGIVILLVLLF